VNFGKKCAGSAYNPASGGNAGKIAAARVKNHSIQVKFSLPVYTTFKDCQTFVDTHRYHFSKKKFLLA